MKILLLLCLALFIQACGESQPAKVVTLENLSGEPQAADQIGGSASFEAPPPIAVQREALVAQIERMKGEMSNPEGLVQAFEANEVSAAERLKGRSILISGTVERIALDVMNKPYIILGPTSGFRKVQCLFTDKSAVSGLSKGQGVTLRGECRGLIMNVLFENCALEDGLPILRARLKAMPKPTAEERSKQKRSNYF